jgi:hypothetical protein
MAGSGENLALAGGLALNVLLVAAMERSGSGKRLRANGLRATPAPPWVLSSTPAQRVRAFSVAAWAIFAWAPVTQRGDQEGSKTARCGSATAHPGELIVTAVRIDD